jgi:pimeloyl-ACP methyl ester carboxylesterase
VARNSEDVLWDPPPPAADERLAYGPEPKQFADLRLPAGPGPFPLAIVLHGGYWKAQYNLIHTGPLCAELAASGIASWNVEYRCVGDVGGGWPGTADDVHLAVAYVERLRQRHPLDEAVIVGHSAGGHLALLAGKRAGLPVVALAAVSDLAEPVRRLGVVSAPGVFLGGAHPDEAPVLYAEASPLAQLPLGVPQTLIHGTADDVVPFVLSERYAAAANAEARLIPLEGAGHFEPIDPLSHEWPQTLAAIREALRR